MLNPSAPQYKVWCLIRLIWTIVRVAQVMGQEAPLAKPNWIFSVVKVNLMWTFSRRVLHLRKDNFSKLLHLILPTLSRALMSCCTLSCANWLHNIFVRALFTRDLLKVGCVIFWSWLFVFEGKPCNKWHHDSIQSKSCASINVVFLMHLFTKADILQSLSYL